MRAVEVSTRENTRTAVGMRKRGNRSTSGGWVMRDRVVCIRYLGIILQLTNVHHVPGVGLRVLHGEHAPAGHHQPPRIPHLRREGWARDGPMRDTPEQRVADQWVEGWPPPPMPSP